MGGGVVAGNFSTDTRSNPASSCEKELPANRQKNDVAGNWSKKRQFAVSSLKFVRICQGFFF
jgi:hypothetical protein